MSKCETCGQERPEPVKLKALPRTDCFRAWQIGNNGIIELHSRLRHGTADKTRAELSAAGYDTTGLAEDGSERLVSESESTDWSWKSHCDELQSEVAKLQEQLAAKDDAELWAAALAVRKTWQSELGQDYLPRIRESLSRLAAIIDAREQPAEPKWRVATKIDLGRECRCRADCTNMEWRTGLHLNKIVHDKDRSWYFVEHGDFWSECEVEDK